jgi:plastocyanin
MKIDITKLPVVEVVIAFFVIVLGVTFAGAFAATDSDGEGAAVAESPTPLETPDNGATPSGGSPSPGGPLQVAMHDNSFDPDSFTVAAGSTAIFDISNEGNALHNMHIAGEGGEFTEDFCEGGGDPCSDPNQVRGGQTATLTWQVPAEPGEVDFRCDFHPTEMTGTITIK